MSEILRNSRYPKAIEVMVVENEGEFRVILPDEHSACIGTGKTKEKAMQAAVRALFATGYALSDAIQEETGTWVKL